MSKLFAEFERQRRDHYKATGTLPASITMNIETKWELIASLTMNQQQNFQAAPITSGDPDKLRGEGEMRTA
jgi:O-succinylbenzoate synthase